MLRLSVVVRCQAFEAALDGITLEGGRAAAAGAEAATTLSTCSTGRDFEL